MLCRNWIRNIPEDGRITSAGQEGSLEYFRVGIRESVFVPERAFL